MIGNPRAVDGEGLHQEFDVRFLRPYFTHHREDFVAMLEALAQNIAAYDAIPNAVFQRLKGEDPGDTGDSVKNSVAEKLKELMSVVKGIEEVNFQFPSFGEYDMRLK